MELRCDLHTHTYYSDGTLAPQALVTRAVAQGLEVLALTDHDTTDGLAEAAAAAATAGLRFIAGVEISVTWQGHTLHVVGLGIDPHHDALARGLKRLRALRHARAREIGERLRRWHRIHGAYEAVRARARRVVSRTHFAQFLVEQGYAGGMREAFRYYLTRGAPAYVPGEWVALEEAVGWIRGASGTAVIAHPARYKLSASKLRTLLAQFKECGGEAIEVISGSHSPEANRRSAALALEHALLASLGSDYHGPENHGVELGRLPALPAGCTPLWERWIEATDEGRGMGQDGGFSRPSFLCPHC